MYIRNHQSIILIFFGALILLFCQCNSSRENSNLIPSGLEDHPLYQYIHSKSNSLQYDIAETNKHEGYTEYILKMVSQHWLSEEEVDATEWWHWVTVVVPDQVRFNTGLLFIGGGSRENSQPLTMDDRLVQAALTTQSVVTHIHNIPFQPLYFKNDTVEYRYEDAIIAWGWRKFLERGAKDEDAHYLARFPMTKAAVLAMDATTEVVKNQKNISVDSFVVAGASKRGWTVWTTAAMDSRVVACIPMVIDLLNIWPSFMHHWQSYGEWSPAVKEYVAEGIMDWMDSKEFARMIELTEPYSFRDLYTMPKLIINGTQDEFFLPDSWQFYREGMPGETHFSYVPNAGHSLGGTYAQESLVAFYKLILEGKDRPKMDWEVTDFGFRIKTDPTRPPAEIKLWKAHNPVARDFRIYILGEAWTSEILEIQKSGIYEITLPNPAEGWQAFMVECTFEGKENLKLTTGVKVLPGTYPYSAFDPAIKKGSPLQ